MVTQAIGTARASGVTGQIALRADCAYANSTVAQACLRAGAQFWLVLTKTRVVDRAIATIGHDAWPPVKRPRFDAAPV